MDRPPGTRTCLYNTAQLAAVVEEMARQAAGLLSGRSRVAVVGILRRGAPLADRLTEALISRHDCPPPLRLDLAIKRYADDLTLLHPETKFTKNVQHETLDLSGRSEERRVGKECRSR